MEQNLWVSHRLQRKTATVRTYIDFFENPMTWDFGILTVGFCVFSRACARKMVAFHHKAGTGKLTGSTTHLSSFMLQEVNQLGFCFKGGKNYNKNLIWHNSSFSFEQKECERKRDRASCPNGICTMVGSVLLFLRSLRSFFTWERIKRIFWYHAFLYSTCESILV